MPNVPANLGVIDQDLSAVVYLSSSSTVLLLLPTTRIHIITTGHNLAFAALPVGVDVLHSAHAAGHQPSTFLRSAEAFLTHCRPCTSLLWRALLTSLLRCVLLAKSLN